MFTVNQLIELLEEYREAGQGDRPVHIAIQPRYPLALRLRGVADGTDAVEDPTDEAEVSEAVWLVASDSHPEGVAYAPENLWEVAKR